MSTRRVVLRGSIRVDARRAQAKLREHLLLDLHGYSLELARAAIALGATAMNVRWDADDVVFAFDGPPIAGERLARLLDFALSDADDEHAAPLRLLALGVNAALGLGADHVTVTSTDDAAACAVRFTPDLFVEGDERPRELRAAPCSTPRDAFTRGTHIHVKKRLGLAVLRRAALSETPREITLLVEHTREAPLRLSCEGAPMARPVGAQALARVGFPLPGARRSFTELARVGAPCRVDIMERGVRLLALSWVPLAGLAGAQGDAVPVRVVVDADELPTNASRSSLREDSPLARELGPASEAAFRKLLAALVARATGNPLPEGVEVLVDDEGAWRDALGSLVCLGVAAQRAGSELDPDVRALFELPLLEAAGGGRIAVGRLLATRTVRVWKSKEPVPEELSPWLSDVVWLRGLLVERVLDGANVEDASSLIKRAREGAARRARFLAHAPGQPSVPQAGAELARERFAQSSGSTQGLAGEVALLVPLAGGAPRPSLLRVYVEERMLEALPIEPSFCPLSFDAAVAWPGGLRPRFDYDGVERDARLNQALYAVSLIAIGIADRAAGRLDELEPPERAVLERMLRDAIATWSVVPARLGQLAPPALRFRREHTQLFQAKLFPTTAGSRVSLKDLSVYAERTQALCVVRSWQEATARPAPDGRPVLVASGAETESILAVLEEKVAQIPYERGVSSAGAHGDTSEGRRAALGQAVADERLRQGLGSLSAQLWFERDGTVVVVAPAVSGASIESHRGVTLSTVPRDQGLSAVIVATDDPASVPGPSWSALYWKSKRQQGWFEQRFTERLVEALEGDEAARKLLGLDSPLTSQDLGITLCLLARTIALAARLASRDGKAERPMEAQHRALLERIEKLPILCGLDADGMPVGVSLARVAARHGDAAPLLEQAPGFATGDWEPLLVRHERERELIMRRFPRSGLRHTELSSRRERAVAEQAQRVLLSRAALDIRAFEAPRLRPGDTVVHLPAAPATQPLGELEVALALPRPELSPGAAWVSLRFDGRPIQALTPSEVGLPLIANVSSTRAADFAAFSSASADGLTRIGARLREASLELLGALAKQGLVLSDSRALALCLALHDLGASELLCQLVTQSDFHFPTVQGGQCPLSLLTSSGQRLLFGSERYPDWLTRDQRESELDRPILFVPPGDLGVQIAALLRRVGHELGDVSGALALLQRQRGGNVAAAPRLDGLPPHAVLRASLWEVGVAAGDGEVELVRGPSSSVSVLLLDGRSESFAVELSCPLRAVARVDTLELAAVRARLVLELEAAAERMLVRAASELDELPTFVRASIRRLLCLQAEARTESTLAAAPAFEDTGGFWHSLGALVTEKRLLFTTLEPPFPKPKKVTLRLTVEEASALGTGIELVRVDSQIERMRAAEQRRTAPQVPTLSLSPEQRVACFITVPVQVEDTTGEVGVLSPAHPGKRGGTLHVGRRPLCTFDDGEGWPLVSVLNDDSVAPDRFFEAPADRSVLLALARRARDVARSALERTVAPSSDALAARWLNDEPAGGFRITGCLWLASRFPASPKVRVYVGEQAAPMVRCLDARRESSPIGTALSLEGDLLVRWAGGSSEGSDGIAIELASTLNTLASLAQTWNALNELGERVAVELVRDARARGVDAAALDEHAFSLLLLGLEATAPPVVAADGTPLEIGDVLAELEKTGALWTSDGQAFAEGAFPGAMPSFFLPQSSPLTRVLEHRAPKGGLRRLGGTPGSPASFTPDELALVMEPPQLLPPDVRALSHDEPSWWESLTSQLRKSLAGEEPRAANAPEHRALLELVMSLHLTGSPVESVALSRAKRPLRYDAVGKRLLLNPAHGAAAVVLRSMTTDSAATCVMAAHAISEVNRALVEVTDGEEQRALLSLLKEL